MSCAASSTLSTPNSFVATSCKGLAATTPTNASGKALDEKVRRCASASARPQMEATPCTSSTRRTAGSASSTRRRREEVGPRPGERDVGRGVSWFRPPRPRADARGIDSSVPGLKIMDERLPLEAISLRDADALRGAHSPSDQRFCGHRAALRPRGAALAGPCPEEEVEVTESSGSVRGRPTTSATRASSPRARERGGPRTPASWIMSSKWR